MEAIKQRLEALKAAYVKEKESILQSMKNLHGDDDCIITKVEHLEDR